LSKKVIVFTKDYFYSFSFHKIFKKKIIEILPFIENNLILNNDFTKTLNEETIKIGFLGRLGEEKGLKDLIKASEIMISKKIRHSIKIAGDLKDARFKKHINDLLELRVNNNCINFIGKIDEDKKSDFFNSIDVLVLPSTNSFEAFGLVQLEAMSFGKPVIASNLRGVRIPIKYTGNGLLYQKGNVNDLVECFVNFKEWVKNINKTKIIKSYNKHFNKEKFSNKYLSLFN
jgi:glycosyltransferase involved in cell wall biosynthesis